MLADRLSGQTVEILSDEDEMPAQKRPRDFQEPSSASGAAEVDSMQFMITQASCHEMWTLLFPGQMLG